jgi:hypothetical protein
MKVLVALVRGWTNFEVVEAKSEKTLIKTLEAKIFLKDVNTATWPRMVQVGNKTVLIVVGLHVLELLQQT